MLIIWSNEALIEFESITNFIAKDNISAAINLSEKIFTSVEIQLTTHPHIGRKGRVKNTFELVVHSSYLIAYEIKSKTINILSIRHTSRLWPENFE